MPIEWCLLHHKHYTWMCQIENNQELMGVKARVKCTAVASHGTSRSKSEEALLCLHQEGRIFTVVYIYSYSWTVDTHVMKEVQTGTPELPSNAWSEGIFLSVLLRTSAQWIWLSLQCAPCVQWEDLTLFISMPWPDQVSRNHTSA